MGGGALSNTWDTARAISAGTPSLLHPPQGNPLLGLNSSWNLHSPAHTFSMLKGGLPSSDIRGISSRSHLR